MQAPKLYIDELELFEERAGTTWMRVATKFQTKVCRRHILEGRACAAKQPVEGEQRCGSRACELHAIAIEACDDCLGPNVKAVEWAALDWILRRRTDPDAKWDTHIDLTEAMLRVGEAFTAAAEAASEPTLKAGSLTSSTGSPASEE